MNISIEQHKYISYKWIVSNTLAKIITTYLLEEDISGTFEHAYRIFLRSSENVKVIELEYD